MLKKLLKIAICMLGLPGLLSGGEHLEQPAVKTIIARGGKAAMPVVVAESATQEVRAAAEKAAEILSRMTGAEFKVSTGDGKSGIAVGIIADFPALSDLPGFDASLPDERQGYEINCRGQGISILGTTGPGVEYGVRDFLYRLGYRRYFPAAKWEIIPRHDELSLGVKVREVPDFFTRRIRQGYGLWPEQRQDNREWEKANREGGYLLRTGHAYGDIIKLNQEEFKKHPEYFALVKNQRSSDKFCLSNPNLRELIVNTALLQFEKNAGLDSFSVEPSDGGNWCECENCARLGSPSTQVVILANEVAMAVRKRFAGKRIGIYAYNYHSPPPRIDVDGDVVVSVATAFLSGGLTLDEILNGWRARKAVTGIREYYNVFMWTFDLPGKSRASNSDYLAVTLPRFYRNGSRHMIAETSDDWGASGPGYYLASRFLWDLREIERKELLVDDFLQKSYGPAVPAMADFHRLLDGGKSYPLCSDLIGRMYRALKSGLEQAAGDPAATSRITDFVLYTRYCELYSAFDSSEDKAKAFQELADFVLSIRDYRVMYSYAFYRERKRIYAKSAPFSPENRSRKFTADEINSIIEAGIHNNELFQFTPVSFSDRLVPAPGLNRNDPKVKYAFAPRRNIAEYYTWIAAPGVPVELEVTGGLIAHYRDRGHVRCELWNLGGASDMGEKETLVQRDSNVPPDGSAYHVKLFPEQTGLHKIVISDGGDKTLVKWNPEIPMTIHTGTIGRRGIDGTFFFYVPGGTETLGFFAAVRRGSIESPDGKRIYQFTGKPGYYSLEIPSGMDGKIWKLNHIAGQINFLTIPQYIAVSPAGLLLPEEVVLKNNLQGGKVK